MYRALISFSGHVSMAEGEIRDISDKHVVDDLLSAGYIEEITPDKGDDPDPQPEKKTETKKKTTRKKKTTSKK